MKNQPPPALLGATKFIAHGCIFRTCLYVWFGTHVMWGGFWKNLVLFYNKAYVACSLLDHWLLLHKLCMHELDITSFQGTSATGKEPINMAKLGLRTQCQRCTCDFASSYLMTNSIQSTGTTVYNTYQQYAEVEMIIRHSGKSKGMVCTCLNPLCVLQNTKVSFKKYI